MLGLVSVFGIFQAVSDWYETNEITWHDEIKESKLKYPYQIKIQPILLGEANYKELVPELKFVEKKHAPQVYIFGTGGGPVNFRRPLNETDYKLIVEQMKKKITPVPPTPTLPTHSEMITMLIELGEILRKYPEREYMSGPYRYDVVWKKTKAGNPTKVFEVQRKGILDSALAKLKHAYDIWNADLFLVITEPKDKDKARFLLAGSFHEIGDVTALMQPEEIKELYESKKRFRELEKRGIIGKSFHPLFEIHLPNLLGISLQGRITKRVSITDDVREYLFRLKGIGKKELEPFKDMIMRQAEKLREEKSVTKEAITHEVVMIPCQYCGGLMPQTATFCPNCGAQRKA